MFWRTTRKSRNDPTRRAQLSVEALEERALLAASLTASLYNGLLVVNGTEAADTITVRQINNQISVDKVAGSFAASKVRGIVVLGRGGDDYINLASELVKGQQAITKPTVILAGAGKDVIVGGAGTDFIFGGDGDDSVLGNSGNDLISGDAGNDTLYGCDGNDVMLGGAGNDLMYGLAGTDIMGGNDGIDRLYGGNGTDILDGGTGLDYLAGENGTDILCDDSLGALRENGNNQDLSLGGHVGQGYPLVQLNNFYLTSALQNSIQQSNASYQRTSQALYAYNGYLNSQATFSEASSRLFDSLDSNVGTYGTDW